MKQFDIVVLGGGIYGLYTALFLSQREVTVAVIDIDQNFFSRASMVNQARLHNGLHYPRGQKTVNTILKLNSLRQKRLSSTLLTPAFLIPKPNAPSRIMSNAIKLTY